MNKNQTKKIRNGAITPKSGKIAVPGMIFFGFMIVVLPLVYFKKTLDPCLMPQLFTVSLFLAIFWIANFLIIKRNFFNRNNFKPIIVWMAVGYLFISILSMFFAVNVKESLFDISKTIVFISVIILTLNLLNESDHWVKYIPLFFLIAISIALIIGFRQYAVEVMPAPDRLLEDGRPVNYLVDGLMAHKNLYASSLFMSLPFLIFGLIQSQKMLRFIYGLITFLLFVMIILLSTRAVWLGILIAVGASSIILLVYADKFGLPTKFRKWALLSMVAILVSGLTVVSSISSKDQFSPIERLKSIFSSKDSNNIYRLHVWELTTNIIKENPMTGVGAGNWKFIAPRYYHNYNFKLNQLNWIGPHNDFLWVLAEKGFPGFLFFVGMFFMAFYYLFSVIRKTENGNHKILALILIGGFIGYLVISFFDFPLERIVHQVWLAIWMAISANLYFQIKQKQPVKKVNFYWLWIILILMILPIIYSYSAIKLEMYVVKARRAQHRKDWKGLLEDAKKIPTQFRNLDAEAMPVYYYQGIAYENLGQYELAKTCYLQALYDHPAKVEIMNNLGLMYFNLKQYEDAKLYFHKAIEILPDFFESLVNLSATYIILEDYSKSLEYLNKIPKNQWDERFYKRAEYLEQKIRQKSIQK